MTRAVVWSALAALALYAGHAALLGSWIVDDAGISFAYARNLASGHGLVSQPGAVPVEGCTNLAWVLLLALTMRLHLFDPVWTPKLLSAACVGLAFAGTAALFIAGGRRPGWLAAAALSVTALCSGFAIWCASGLENALYIVLVVALGLSSTIPSTTPEVRDRRAAVAGIMLFFLYCTRPDAALYFWIPAFLFGIASREGRRPLGIYIVTFIGLWVLLTLFRGIYFHDVFPNTFYAKKGEGAKIFAWMLARMPLVSVVATVIATGTLVIAVIGSGFHALGRWLAPRLSADFGVRHVLLLLFLTAYVIVLALPGDWMLEHRFATPMFLYGPAAGLALAWESLAGAGTRRRTALVGIAAAAAVMVTAAYSARHTPAFVRAPALAFDAVRANSRRMAAALPPIGPQATVLTPDVGGALWENRFRVLDLVGLTDRELGREVRRDRESIARHILEVRRPAGVWVHTFWMGVTGFDADPAFAASYSPVWEDRAAPGAPPAAGFYVRRDLASPASEGATYTVIMQSVAEPKLTVTAELPIDGDALEMQTTRPGGIPELDAGGWPALVTGLRVADPAGRSVELASAGTSGWKLAQPYHGRLTVEYDVDCAPLANRGWPAPREAALADSNHLVAVGRALFITTDDVGTSSVDFVLPPGWRAVTAWEARSGSTQAFVVGTAADLVENLMVITRTAPDVVTAGGFRLSVTSMGHWAPARAEVRNLLGAVIPRLVGLLQVDVPENYLVVLLPVAEDGGESYRHSFALTQEVAPARANSARWGNTIAHEIFHQWNGWGLRGADYPTSQWFQEGFTEYAANIAMVAAQQVTPEEFLQELTQHVAQYRKLTTSLEAGGAHKGPPLYSGGALVALLWDVQIRHVTAGERSLWDFMQALWTGTEKAGRRYEWQDIRAALEATAPLDWEAFYRSHIQGSEPLQLGPVLAQAGIRLGHTPDGAERFEFDPAAPAVATMLCQALLAGE